MALSRTYLNYFYILQGFLTSFLFLHGRLAVKSEIIDKCDIAIHLDNSNFSTILADQWVCLVEELSNRNSSAIKRRPSSYQNNESDSCQQYSLGLFQISNAWCSTPGNKEFGSCTQNGCNLDCFKLLDDDINDDIKCIKSIYELHGFTAWSQLMVNECRRGMSRSSNNWNITACLASKRQRQRKLTSIPLWAALIIVAVSSLTVFTLTYFFYRYRRNSVPILSPSEVKHFKYGRISSTRPRPHTTFSRASELFQDSFANEPYNADFEITPSKFVIDFNKCIGSGAYGIVYKALCRGKIVAVKTVKPNATKEYLQSLLGEIKILCHIGRHDFIVNLEGAYTKNLAKGTLYVFMEFCALGSLENFLRSNRNNYLSVEEIPGNERPKSEDKQGTLSTISSDRQSTTLTFKHLLQYAHQIAKGMEFLASKQVIHGDLAARNILLVDQNVAKISDFGLSRKLYGYINYIKTKEEPLPWRYMSIESLRENHFSTASDVWMYGVLLFEVFSLGEIPYPGLSWSLDFVNKLEEGFRLLKPKHAPVNLYKDIMKKCWEINPGRRPRFPDLSNYFHQALHQITAMDYTELVVEDKEVFQIDTNKSLR